MDDIPEFLRRTSNQEKQNMPTAVQQISDVPIANASGPKSKTRQARKDAYIARLIVKIPLDMTNGQTLVEAMDAVKRVGDHFPAGAVIEVSAGMGKI